MNENIRSGTHRVKGGDQIQLVTTSRNASQAFARAIVTYDDGEDAPFETLQTPNSDRTVATTLLGRIDRPGFVTRCVVGIVSGTVKRGENFAELAILDSAARNADMLAAGYIGNNKNLPLDFLNQPTEGRGFKHNNRIANDVTPADIEHTLGITNALRRIDGFIWYYHCSSDVASRTLRASVRDLGDGLPTGLTSGINTSIKNYPTAGVLTLTANEEGVIYVNAATGKSFAASLDNSALTIEDITTQPDPFPYWAQEDDVGELFFLHANEEAADRETIYIIEEEWIQI